MGLQKASHPCRELVIRAVRSHMAQVAGVEDGQALIHLERPQMLDRRVILQHTLMVTPGAADARPNGGS
jgi:hypothetical protein